MVPVKTEEAEDISASKSDHGDMDDDLQEEAPKPEVAHVLTPEQLEKLYVFALVWATGGLLDADDRAKFDEFLKDKLNNLALPQNSPKNPKVSMF